MCAAGAEDDLLRGGAVHVAHFVDQRPRDGRRFGHVPTAEETRTGAPGIDDERDGICAQGGLAEGARQVTRSSQIDGFIFS